MSMDIDFVVTWVDGGDPVWRAERARYLPNRKEDNREIRYRDWDQMRYWFRAVEKYAPWVRKIHFVTWGHLPVWLDTSNPKLHIVNHKDYIPGEYLPTFCSDTIEMFMHRIDGLAEHFVYFNDDLFCNAPLQPDDFFHNGLPRDMMAFQPVIANPSSPAMSYTFLNNSMLLARHFTKRENVRKQPGAYFKLGYPLQYFVYNFLELAFPQFTGMYTAHNAAPFLKQTFLDVWDAEGEYLSQALMGKFRDRDHVSQYVVREWQKFTGNFVPTNVHRSFRYFSVSNDNSKLIDTILHQKAATICLNDADPDVNFEKAKNEINAAFAQVFTERSSFEK